MIVTIASWLLWFCVGVMLVYMLRHHFFTVNRLFSDVRQPYVDVLQADWPLIDVYVPAHNESRVIRDSIEALLSADYPTDKLRIIPVDDRSTDGTREILQEYAALYPDRIFPVYRDGGIPGKAAALAEAMAAPVGEICLVFDADYVPGPRLLKQLASPFFDAEVGAVMGRVVPLNISKSLLTRLLDLERTGGYQVDQQARMNLHLIPQYGGTVGGVRRVALLQAGGWNAESLAEDTDLTFRLVMNGWSVVYQNRSECYEEVPETWDARMRQIRRWAKGHNQVMRRYMGDLIRNRIKMPRRQFIDGILLLGVYAVPIILLIGWACAIILFYAGYPPSWGRITILAVMSFNTVGNFAAFFQVAAGSRLDGSRERIRMLPFLLFGFIWSMLTVARATLSRESWMRNRPVKWEKTERFRSDRATTLKARASRRRRKSAS